MTATTAAAPSAAKISRGKGSKAVAAPTPDSTPVAPPKVKAYKIRPLNFNMEMARLAGAMRDNDKLSIAAIAAKLNKPLNGDKSATKALIVFDHGLTPDRSLHGDVAAQAKAVYEMRKDRASWGKVSARYDITESCARRLYEIHTGQSFNAIDLRRRNGGVVSFAA